MPPPELSDAAVALLRLLARRNATVSVVDGDLIVMPPVGPRAAAARLGPDCLERLLAQDFAVMEAGIGRITRRGRSELRRRLAIAAAASGSRPGRRHAPARPRRHQRPPRTTTETPLRWLASRNDPSGAPMITTVMLHAGERLRADWFFAGLDQRVTASWDPTAEAGTGGAGGLPDRLSDRRLDARDRVNRALRAVGPELSRLLIAVCCEERGLGSIERDAGWPLRSAKVVLRIALEMLAIHYGMATGQPERTAQRR